MQKAELQPDRFVSIEIAAACAAAMLPYSDAACSVAPTDVLLEKLVPKLEATLDQLCRDLEADRFALLRCRNGLADLFYLPLRITRVLGWAAFAHLYRILGPEGDKQQPDRLATVTDLILKHHGPAISFMSEGQAPYVAVLLAVAQRCGLEAQAKEIVRFLFVNMINIGTKSARASIEAERVFDYMLARSTGDFSEASGLCSRPSEFALVVLRGAAALGIEEEVDDSLIKIDRSSVIAFLPSRLDQFSDELMRDGTNVIFRIGFDVWTVSDVERAWPTREVVIPKSRSEFLRCIISSFLFPNRVPWFVLERTAW